MTNQERAEIAKGLAEAFAQMTGMRHESAQTIAGDFVCDLMHYVRQEGGDPHAILESGRMHFDAEERGED